jgi:hypothetical protein
MEFDPTDNTFQTIIAGRGAVSSFGVVSGPLNGLMLTTNGGNTWTEITPPILQGQAISGLAKRGNIILVASNPFFSTSVNPGPGLFRSTDNGATFTRVSGAATSGLPSGGIFDLVSDPTNANRYYASVHGQGIYRSDDAGVTWTNVSQNDATLQAAAGLLATTNLEMAIATTGRIYAGVVIQNQLQLMAFSSDFGATWNIMDLPLTNEGQFGVVGLNPRQKPGGQGFIHFSIAVDPTNPDLVYVGGDRQDGIDIQPGPDGIFLTADDIRIPNSIGARDFSGRLFRGDASVAPAGTVPSPQWTPLTHAGTARNSAPHADSREMTFDALGNLIETDDGGVYRRTNPRDATGDWFSMNGTLQVTEIHDIIYDTVSNVLVAGTQDVGTPQQFFEGSDVWGSVSTADGGDVIVDDISLRAQNQSIRYTSNQFLGGFRRRSYDQNGVFIPNSEVRPALTVVQGAPLNPQFVTPAALNEVQPTRLIVAGGNSLYESFDRGETLIEIGPGLVVNAPVSGIAANPIVYGGVLNGVANPDVLWVGSLNIVALRTQGTGPVVSTPTVFPGDFVADIALDSDDWRRAFIADGNGVWTTPDAGVTWAEITGNLNSTSVRSIEFVPNTEEGFIVVGTQNGVFKMDVDTPGVWERFGQDLPNVLIFDMDYDEEDDVLVLGTMGRGSFQGQISRGEQIRGTKWVDRDADGTRDFDEPGFPGVTIYIDRNNNGVLDVGEPSDVTDALGDYSIQAEIGVHIVREVVPAATFQTFPPSGFHRVVLQVEDEVVNNVDFGNKPEPSAIHGVKFFDEDGDGVRDEGEAGQPGVAIQLMDSTGVAIEQTVTDRNGAYRFVNLDPGSYIVDEILPTNQIKTFPSQAVGGVHRIDLQPSQIRIDINFGNYGLRGSISGRKFNDANGNGVKDRTELGVAGAIIYVDSNQNGVFNYGEPSQITDEFGQYTIPGLIPGEYVVREFLPDGTTQTSPGGNGSHDVVVIAGRDTPNINFGNRAFFDFGDAPAPFATTRAQGGAMHGIRTGFYLGARVDSEVDGQPNATATGDDNPGSSFSSVTTTPVGDFPVGGTAANLDGERGLDVVVVNQNANTVSVLLNNSDGSFADAVDYPVGAQPSRVAAGDFDGDGDVDLAVTNTGSDNVTILRNRGDGTFIVVGNEAGGMGPRGIAAGDIDRDGDVDLVVSNFTSDTISVLLNDGMGDFATPVVFDVNEGPAADVALGDIDRDGDLDVVVVNSASDSVSVLLNLGLNVDGDLTFDQPFDFVVGDDPQQVVLADFNRDNRLDIATANALDANVSVLLNRGGGAFFPAQNIDVGGLPVSLSAADIDADLDPDLVVATRLTGRAVLLVNNGNGTFSRGQDFVGGGVAVFVITGDFNNDAGADVVFVNRFTDDITTFGSTGDDEDGIALAPQPLVAGRPASFTATASANGILSAWLDYNRDGDWNDPGEQIVTNQNLTQGANRIFFTVPTGAVPGATFARFRFSDQLNVGPTGPANAGEVEDYLVNIAGAGGTPGSAFTNPQNPLDVNADGLVTLNDVLVLINDLRANGIAHPVPTGVAPPPFIDPSGDGFVTLNDALLVINGLLTQMAANGEGEGEAVDAWAFDPASSSKSTLVTASQDSENRDALPAAPTAKPDANVNRTTLIGNARKETASLVASAEEDWDDTLDAIADDVCSAWEKGFSQS